MKKIYRWQTSPQKYSTSLTIRKMQIKASGRYYISIKMTKTKIVTPIAGEDVEKLDHSYTVGRNVKMVQGAWELLIKLNMPYILTIALLDIYPRGVTLLIKKLLSDVHSQKLKTIAYS